jgi:hypothetical protein
MENNIIHHPAGTIILNGGNPLPGCPKDWEEARSIEIIMNKNKLEYEPQWRFDCGFKLDYDCDLLSISSRFYPPKTHYGGSWDGIVKIVFCGNKIYERNFDCVSLDELQLQVETYVKQIFTKIESSLNSL